MFRVLADAEINIDMVIQNISSLADNRTDITFTCPRADGPRAVELLMRLQNDGTCRNVLYDDQIGKVSLVGAGMRSHPGVSAKLFSALSQAGINIHMISTSEIRLSVVVDDAVLDEAVRAVHSAFGLDAQAAEAVVYGGTGP